MHVSALSALQFLNLEQQSSNVSRPSSSHSTRGSLQSSRKTLLHFLICFLHFFFTRFFTFPACAGATPEAVEASAAPPRAPRDCRRETRQRRAGSQNR